MGMTAVLEVCDVAIADVEYSLFWGACSLRGSIQLPFEPRIIRY